jgi:hypothetical protein
LLVKDEVSGLRKEVEQLRDEMKAARDDLATARGSARGSGAMPAQPSAPKSGRAPMEVTVASPIRVAVGSWANVEFIVTGERRSFSDIFEAHPLRDRTNGDDVSLEWDAGKGPDPIWVYRQVDRDTDRFYFTLHCRGKPTRTMYDLRLQHAESGRCWKIPIEIIGNKESHSGSCSEPARVTLRSEAPIYKEVQAHVLVDGTWKCSWPNDQQEISFALSPGQHEIVVRSVVRSKGGDHYFRKAIICSPPAAGAVDVTIGKMDTDAEGRW